MQQSFLIEVEDITASCLSNDVIASQLANPPLFDQTSMNANNTGFGVGLGMNMLGNASAANASYLFSKRQVFDLSEAAGVRPSDVILVDADLRFVDECVLFAIISLPIIMVHMLLHVMFTVS